MWVMNSLLFSILWLHKIIYWFYCIKLYCYNIFRYSTLHYSFIKAAKIFLVQNNACTAQKQTLTVIR